MIKLFGLEEYAMKRLPAVLWILALCAGLLIYSIFAPNHTDLPPQGTTAPTPAPTGPSVTVPPTEPTEAPTAPSTEPPTDPSQESMEAPTTEPATEPSQSGQIRVLVDGTVPQAAWEALAGAYRAKTGVEVILVTDPAQATLSIASADTLDPDRCADLSTTGAYGQLVDWGLSLRQGDRVYAIAADVECYGLLCNESLMAQAAHTCRDITDFQSLTQVVNNISAAGLHPFAGPEYQGHFAARIASLGTNIRPLLDLWTASYCGGDQRDTLHRFSNNETVFYLGSTGEYEELAAIGPENLSILPIYTDGPNEQNQSLSVAAKTYFAVSNQGSEADILETLNFLDNLMMADGESPAPVDTLELLAPYRQATYVSNPLEQILRSDIQSGKTLTVCRYITQAPEGLPEALTAYTANPTDENWSIIADLLKGA